MIRTAIVAIAMALLGWGCSSFNREWREAEKMPVTAGDIAGRWEGTWKSEASGHSGNLKCIISPASQPSHYSARFHAKYAKIFSFTYTVDLEVRKQGEIFQFTGSADLGNLGGVYKYEGDADKSRFLSSYASKDDHGTFEMLKVLPP